MTSQTRALVSRSSEGQWLVRRIIVCRYIPSQLEISGNVSFWQLGVLFIFFLTPEARIVASGVKVSTASIEQSAYTGAYGVPS